MENKPIIFVPDNEICTCDTCHRDFLTSKLGKPYAHAGPVDNVYGCPNPDCYMNKLGRHLCYTNVYLARLYNKMNAELGLKICNYSKLYHLPYLGIDVKFDTDESGELLARIDNLGLELELIVDEYRSQYNISFTGWRSDFTAAGNMLAYATSLLMLFDDEGKLKPMLTEINKTWNDENPIE